MHRRTVIKSSSFMAAWLLALVIYPCVLAAPTAQTLTEAQVKAAFLINFAKFVEWPPQTFGGIDTPILIGILGDDPFGSALDEAVRGKVIDGHRVQVRRLKSSEDWSDVQILFISDSEEGTLQAILERVGNAPVLVVSDIRRFCRSGGNVGFITEKNRVQFEINLASAERQGLKISSKLLALAMAVQER